jgi:DNA-binding NarL/FixJ family response regulator
MMDLNKREREVMELIAEGKNNASIAKELHRSIYTIRSRIKNIYIKLNIDGNQYNKRLKLALYGQGLDQQDGGQ